MTEQPTTRLTEQLSFRVSSDTFDFYRRLAEKKRRKMSDMVRLVLEDQAKVLAEKMRESDEESQPAAA